MNASRARFCTRALAHCKFFKTAEEPRVLVLVIVVAYLAADTGRLAAASSASDF